MAVLEIVSVSRELLREAPLGLGYLHRVTLLLAKVFLYVLLAQIYTYVLCVHTPDLLRLALLSSIPLFITLDLWLRRSIEQELVKDLNISALRGVSEQEVRAPQDFLAALFSKKLEMLPYEQFSTQLPGALGFLAPAVLTNCVVFPLVLAEFLPKLGSLLGLELFGIEHSGLVLVMLYTALAVQFLLLLKPLSTPGEKGEQGKQAESSTAAGNPSARRLGTRELKEPTAKSMLKSMARIVISILAMENEYGEYILKSQWGLRGRKDLLLISLGLAVTLLLIHQPWNALPTKREDLKSKPQAAYLVFSITPGAGETHNLDELVVKAVPQCVHQFSKGKGKSGNQGAAPQREHLYSGEEGKSKNQGAGAAGKEAGGYLEYILEACGRVFSERIGFQMESSKERRGLVFIKEYESQKRLIRDKEACSELFSEYLATEKEVLRSFAGAGGSVHYENFQTFVSLAGGDALKKLFEEPVVLGLGGDSSSATSVKTLKSMLKAAELLGDKPPLNKFVLFLPVIYLERKHVTVRTMYREEQIRGGGSQKNKIKTEFKYEGFNAYFAVPFLVLMGFFSESERVELLNSLARVREVREG